MKHFFLFVLFLTSAMFMAGASHPEEELRVFLRKEHRPLKSDLRYIDSLKNVRLENALSVEGINASEKLGHYFIRHNLDSALMYWRLGYENAVIAGLEDEELRLRLCLDCYLPLKGMGTVADYDFKQIDPEKLDRDVRWRYYLAAAELYYNIQLPFKPSEHKQYFLHKTLEAIDSVLPYYDPSSETYQYLQAHAHTIRGDETLGAAVFAEVLPKLENKPNMYIRAAKSLASYYKSRPDKQQQYFYLLCTMAVRGFKEGVVRPSVLAELGKELIRRGDIENGRRCIYLALTSGDAESGVFAINDVADYAAYLIEDPEKRSWVNVVPLCILGIMFLAAVSVAFVMWRKLVAARKYSEERRTIASEREKILKGQVRNSASLAILGIDQIQEFNRNALRKLTAGQTKAFFSELESGKIVQACRERFFNEFDEKFLMAHPDFIERLNELLREDARFEILTHPPLSPELRIAAFMSVGFNDSAMLAQSLGLSLNTVYTYRNRLKGRAIDRSSLEDKLQNLVLPTI